MATKRLSLLAFRRARRAVGAFRLTANVVEAQGDSLLIAGHSWTPRNGRLVVVGAGKAAAGMARGLLSRLQAGGWDPGNVCGWINVPDGDACELPPLTVWPCRPPGENLPTERSVEGTREIVRLVEGLEKDDLCVCLISGGGSALLAEPVAEITLDDKRELIRWLDWSGANIRERNQVRRELSTIKGGRLLERAGPGRIVTLLISDVLGDPLELVASGPTVPTLSRPDLALQILERLAGGSPVAAGVPEAVVECLRNRVKQTREAGTEERPVPSSQAGRDGEIVLLGNLQRAADAAASLGRRLGYHVAVNLQNNPHETVHDAAARIADWLMTPGHGKRMLVDAGEPVLRLGEPCGRGGRNQHLVLAVAKRLYEEGQQLPDRWSLLSGGTDGEDGNTAAAGGVIDEVWFHRMKDRVDEIGTALNGFDSASLLTQTGAQLVTGPTGTNVGDLRIAVVDG